MRRKIRVGLLIDHAVDQRLRKRIRRFENLGVEIEVFTDNSKGKWLSSRDWETKAKLHSYKDFGRDTDFDLLYVSGGKVFIQMFFKILKVKSMCNVVAEIPDLPLRFKINLLNKCMGYVFSGIVKYLSNIIVLTSPGFESFFQGFPRRFFLENVPDLTVLSAIKRSTQLIDKGKDFNTISIGFVGAIRYLPQLAMIAKYVCSANYSPSVELHFFGGPTDKLVKMIADDLKLAEFIDKCIFVHGHFNYESDIADIYSNVDIVYSVYDSSQLNVRLALPNKLYESMAANKPIIVSCGTYLYKKVKELSLGWGVVSDPNDQTTFNEQMNEILIDYQSRSFIRDYMPELLELTNQEQLLFTELHNLLHKEIENE